ncbi:S9 family peptidase [Kangiella sp. TOML190]|uniref:S9 family peptidase n=1 Tax=Kangiella sp. TOML190 TaxID=2931351 RepID=UPI002041F4ED|nr:S9 family peptidase [Kangiella sp. TOML190]
MNKLLIFLVFITMPLASISAKEGMTLEDIAKISSVNQVEVSPNGDWIAFTKSKARMPYKDDDGGAWIELYLMATADRDTVRPFITGKVNIGNISWSKDSKKIYYTAKRHDDKKTSLYAIPVDGGESQKVASHKSGVGAYSINHDGSKAVFIAKPEKPKHLEKLKKKGFKAKVYEEDIQQNHLWSLDLTKEDAKPKKVNFKQHLISARFNPVNDQLLVQSAPTSLIDDVIMKTTLQVIDLKGKVKTTFKTQGKQGKAIWSSDGKLVAFLGANDFNDPTAGALYVANARTGKMAKRKNNFDSHIMDLAWHANDVYYIEHKDAESRVVKSDGNSVSPIVRYGNGIQVAISIADNGQVALKTNSATHPNEVYLANQRMTDSNPWLKEIELGKQEVFNYKAQDGLDIQGIVVYPVNYKKGKAYPMIAFVHGGPEAHRSNGWNTRYADPLQVAAAQGYVSFVPNYRGSTGRGDEFARADQHAYADPEFTDIVDGKNALVEKGIVNKDKVGITGGSYGGFATAWSATALSEHYAAGVMFVGISNQLSKFGTTDIPNEMHAVHARAWPWDDFQWMLERSPIYHVKKAKTPLLIMHGENDTRVHPSQSMEMYRYLKTLGQAPVRLVLYPGEGHGNRKAAAQLDYSMRLMRWMDHYLKGKGGKPPKYDLEHEKKLDDDKDKKDK